MSITNNQEALTATDILALKTFIDTAKSIYQQIDDLNDSLKDTAKGIAEKLPVEMKASVLLKTAKSAYKASLKEEKQKLDMVEELLVITGNPTE